MAPTGDDARMSREIRFAVVMYGGVSLRGLPQWLIAHEIAERVQSRVCHGEVDECPFATAVHKP